MRLTQEKAKLKAFLPQMHGMHWIKIQPKNGSWAANQREPFDFAQGHEALEWFPQI
jgi:hypothetical protein